MRVLADDHPDRKLGLHAIPQALSGDVLFILILDLNDLAVPADSASTPAAESDQEVLNRRRTFG